MGLETEISWADSTINPWVGCSRGCDYCYMASMARRSGQDPAKLSRTSDASFHLPTAKKRDGSWRLPSGSLVFVCSYSDFFDVKAPDSWRYEFFEEIKARPDVNFALLTKSVENMVRFMDTVWAPNVWLGVTVENQAIADQRLPHLEQVSWPKRRFISAGPLHGPLDITPWVSILDWVIVSGQAVKTKLLAPAWVRAIQTLCRERHIDLWFTQWGVGNPEGKPTRSGKGPKLIDGKMARVRPSEVY